MKKEQIKRKKTVKRSKGSLKSIEKKLGLDLDDEVSYLETCAYYKILQDAVSKLVNIVSPMYMVELGCGNGNTTVRLALENPMTSIVALEMMQERFDKSSISATNRKIRNITFIQGDFTQFKNFNLRNAELVVMVYSFAWVLDDIKERFLKELYKELSPNAYVLIADTFLHNREGSSAKQLQELFHAREKESKGEAFWNNLESLAPEDIAKAQNFIEWAEANEGEIYKDARERTERCFVSKNWLASVAKKVGFNVVLSEYVNGINDGIILLQK